ncbi:MAG: LysM peptidoglycan-binding domain-containing protein [Patescibacteria group bacterium]|nr:LysM peptidoglycan-binding domain-containing protein [Patescibacteria group bacterium]MCL5095323.1 LysM peptidoglycan-binding domain-containing protein [Patescibacteria group bacterium]
MWKKFLKSLKLSESYVSMALGLLVVIVIGILLFNFFSGGRKNGSQAGQSQTEEKKEAQVALPATYTVAEGDTLWSISEKFFKSGYNWSDIAKENQLSNPDYLEAGQQLKIPKVEPILPLTGITEAATPSITGGSYTVVTGDDLWDIAVRAYGDGYQWSKIAQANNLVNPNLIHAGNVLTLPR